MKLQGIMFSKEKEVAVITLNRPPMNVLRYETYYELNKARRGTC